MQYLKSRPLYSCYNVNQTVWCLEKKIGLLLLPNSCYYINHQVESHELDESMPRKPRKLHGWYTILHTLNLSLTGNFCSWQSACRTRHQGPRSRHVLLHLRWDQDLPRFSWNKMRPRHSRKRHETASRPRPRLHTCYNITSTSMYITMDSNKINVPFINSKQTRMKSRTDVLNCHTSYECCQHFVHITDCRHTSYNRHSQSRVILKQLILITVNIVFSQWQWIYMFKVVD